jgi:hypothetical protein
MSTTARPYCPRPYQADAEAFLGIRGRANLHAEPGLGKTAIMLQLLWRWLPADMQTLVIAPRLVALNVWAKEHLQWSPLNKLRVTCLTGVDDRDKALTLAIERADLTVAHPDKLVWLLKYYQGSSWPFKCVIWDESTRLQGFRTRQGTQRSRAISDVAHTHVKQWYNLSGTPNANSYEQLWGPQWFIDGGEALGRTYSAYLDRYFMRPANGGEYAKLQLIPEMKEAIQERLKPTTFTVRAAEHMNLAEPIETTRCFELPAQARAQYRAMQRDFSADFRAGQVTAANAGVKWGKLRQISAGCIYHDLDGSIYSMVHSERLELLEALVQELQGAPLLVVYKYRHEMIQIKDHFHRAARELREKGAIEAWNEGKVRILLAHPASAGHGLNLQQGGHHLCFYSPLSDNELYSQVLARIGPVRQAAAGFKRPVYIYHFEAEKTVDQWDRQVRQGRIDEAGGFMLAMSETS